MDVILVGDEKSHEAKHPNLTTSELDIGDYPAKYAALQIDGVDGCHCPDMTGLIKVMDKVDPVLVKGYLLHATHPKRSDLIAIQVWYCFNILNSL